MAKRSKYETFLPMLVGALMSIFPDRAEASLVPSVYVP